MAREAKDIQIEGSFVSPGERSTWVRTGEDTAVPSKIGAQMHLLDPRVVVWMLITVDPGGRALVREFHISPRDLNASVTTTLLRKIPMDFLLRAALEKATVKGQNRPDIHPDAFQVPGEPAEQAWVSPRPTGGRGREVPRGRVIRAAEAYNQALAQGSRAPAEAVAAVLGYSRATAARDIRAARELGLIAPSSQASDSSQSAQPTTSTPYWQRFDDPNAWAPMDDVLSGPMGLPVVHPSQPGGSTPDPVPVRAEPEAGNDDSAGGDADAANE